MENLQAKSGLLINRLKNSFSEKVNIGMEKLNKNVLPGNPLLRDYQLLDPSGSYTSVFIKLLECPSGEGDTAASSSSSSSTPDEEQNSDDKNNRIEVWRIFEATKRSTRESASLFLSDKNRLSDQLAQLRAGHLLPELIELIKKSAAQLTRLRHPNILRILSNLEESRDDLVFATESVRGSLQWLIDHSGPFRGAGGPSSSSSSSSATTTDEPQEIQMIQIMSASASGDNRNNSSTEVEFLSSIEIIFGLKSILSSLEFLHSNLRYILTGNLNFGSIFITSADGQWKLGPTAFLFFSPPSASDDGAGFPSPFLDCQVKKHQGAATSSNSSSLSILPDPTFCAPEFFRHLDDDKMSSDGSTQATNRISLKSDVWSFGFLALNLFHIISRLADGSANNRGQQQQKLLLLLTPTTDYKRKFSEVQSLRENLKNQKNFLSKELNFDQKMFFFQILDANGSKRPNSLELKELWLKVFTAHSPENQKILFSLDFLSSLQIKSAFQKAEFYRAVLPEILPKIPKSVQKYQMISALSSETTTTCNSSPEILPFVLRILFLITESSLDSAEFAELLYPKLLQVFQSATGGGQQVVPQTFLILLNKIPLILSKLSQSSSSSSADGSCSGRNSSLKSSFVDPILVEFLTERCLMFGSSYPGPSASSDPMTVAIQETTLKLIPTICSEFNQLAAPSQQSSNPQQAHPPPPQNLLKSRILPVIQRLFKSTPVTSVKVNCLVSIGKILPDLDKFTLYEEIFPFLVGQDPGLLRSEISLIMSTVGILLIGVNHSKFKPVSKEVAGTLLLPFLCPCPLNTASINLR